ncbi:MAG: hypothetical protein M0Q51_06390 [Bacteroidales bacterium]|nr:hypothetical protein [Bacteroidales bacterium]
MALPQKISELPPATFMGIGDLTVIVQNGVTKKLPYSSLINSLHMFSDSLYINYRCHSVKGQSRWYYSGDTLFIDTCSVSVPLGSGDSCLFELHGDTIWNKNGYKAMFDDSVYFMRDAIKHLEPHSPLAGFLTLGKLDNTGRRQLVMASFRHDSIQGIKIPLTVTSANYTSTVGSEAVAFIDLSHSNDTLFLGSATTRLNDMIYVARSDLLANSVVINATTGIYYKSAGYTNFWLSKTMSGAILQSDGIAWYIIGVFFDPYLTPTRAIFPDSTLFSSNVQFNSSIHALNLDSARTSYSLYYNAATGEFSYDSIPVALHSIDTLYVVDSVYVMDTVIMDSPDQFSRDPFITIDSTAKGNVCRQIAGQTLVFGDLCYLKSDGKAYLADADSVIYLPGLFLLADKSGASANDTATFLEDGYMRCNARWSWSTKGAVLYASCSNGGMADSSPSGSNDGIQAVGIVQTADIVKFKPDLLIIELN